MSKRLLFLSGLFFQFSIHAVASTASSDAQKASLKVISVGEQSAAQGPKENFVGSVSVKMLVEGESPSNLTCGSVAFSPGARSNWHTHPRGQLLIVTDGEGLVQEWGKPARKIKNGDVIWTPPNVKHWHGASRKMALTHSAVTETLDGKAVIWMERVSDEDYSKASK